MRSLRALAVVCFGLLGAMALSQSSVPTENFLGVRPVVRVVAPVTNDDRVVLPGNRHPLARAEYAVGRVPPEAPMDKMVLVLAPDAAQETALEELLAAQQDPESSYYQHWLTPVEFGRRFGVSQHDMQAVTQWIESWGMRVEDIPASRRSVVFSGTAAQVEAAFHTRIQQYEINGELRFANATDVQIPRALAPVIRGVLALHDFRSVAQHTPTVAPGKAGISPSFTMNGSHYLMPADWATIYDVAPLYSRGLAGTGVSIAVLGRVDVALSDVRSFRTSAGLPSNDPQFIVNGTDPGFSSIDDEFESALDVEWAGAIATNATVKFVTSASTTSDGISLSAQYAVNHNVAPIISLSYGACEAAIGSGGNAFWNSTWQQAAAQGQTVLVASGDNGAAGCDSPNESAATQGRGVNGLCSSPYSTCVGGTQFNDTANPGQYWSTTNGSGSGSALGYIPESVWNESSWSGGLWAGGGGASILYNKPSWQSATGVPADGMRDVPDVALHASIDDSYIIEFQGAMNAVSGTSAATPSLASVMALLLQSAGVSQGNVNPTLYTLGSQQYSTGTPLAFHDVTLGNNSVPGVTGFSAGTGYDQGTGLGSVDASVLVNAWSNTNPANFALASNLSSATLAPGGSTTANISLVDQGGFSSAVTLSASGMPTGVTVKFSSTTASATSPVTMTITASSSAAAGSSTITIKGTGGGLTRTATLALTIAIPTYTLTESASSASVTAANSTAVTVTTASSGGFKSAVSLSVSGLPKGVTATFSPTSIASPGSGSATLTLKVAAGTLSSVSKLTITATGGSVTKTQSFTLTIVGSTFTLTLAGTQAIVSHGGTLPLTVTTAVQNGFSSAVALSVSGLPKNVTAAFSPTSIASPGSGSSTLTFTAASTAAKGTSTITVTGTGGGVTQTKTLSLTVQ